MSAGLTLCSVALLLALLIHGRWSASLLFTIWAGGYYLVGLISETTLLSSYANPALTTLVLLLLVSLVFERSAVLDRVTLKLLSGRETLASLKLMVVTASFSAFLNNTAVVGTLLGSISRQKVIPPSRLLIPLSYAAIFGGITTLVGTSTNLVVNSLAMGSGLPALGMFQLAWVGVPVALVCIAVLSVCAHWLPSHDQDVRENSQSYFLEARVLPGSNLVGRSIQDNGLRQLHGLFLLEIERASRLISPVGPDQVLESEDILLFTGEVEKLQALQGIGGLEFFGARSESLLSSNLVEVIVSSESELANKTLRDVDFRTMFDAGVVGIRRGDRRLTGQLGRIPLKVGDSLLLAVGPDFALHRNLDRNFHLLGRSWVRQQLSGLQSAVALGSFGLVIAGSAAGYFGLLPGLILLLCLFLAARLVSLAELRRRFPFELMMVIGSSLALASGLESSGAAQLIATVMRTLFDGYGVYGALIGVYFLTLVLTELISNNAAAALVFPIALATARTFGVEPAAFVLIVVYGASASFLIPFGYQTHLMVMTPGRYRTVDFLRMGVPVSLAYSAVVLLLTPVFFPLKLISQQLLQ
jgi:di/tricarboxylate transporter